MIRIALVDDHLFLRVGLKSMIDDQPDMKVVVEAGGAEEAIAKCALERPDIAIMDIRMPGTSGIDCTVALQNEAPETKVIMLTTFDTDENLYRSLNAGAHAFLLKDLPKAEFLDTVRAVHRGDYILPPAVEGRMAEHLLKEPLSKREVDIIRGVAAGLSNKEIGVKLFITESTVKGHLNRILVKLNARARTDAVISAIKRGLITIE